MRRVLSLLLGLAGLALAAEPQVQRLPAPRTTGGKPLLDALRERRTIREISPQPLSAGMLSDLLWAAFGVNRAETGQRTAPSTMNLQAIEVYVATADGAFRYDAVRHGLVPVAGEDLRLLTGEQDYVKVAPVALLYVADHARLAKVAPAERDFYAAADAGFIGQNVYLFCASEGLASVVHTVGNKPALGRRLGLNDTQRIVLAHSVGYPVPAAAGKAP